MKFRIANIDDFPEIVKIYNEAISYGGANADTEPVEAESKLTWFELHKTPYFILICEIDNKIVAWCSISPYRQGRKALAKTAEISYYVLKEYQGQGIGKKIIQESIKQAVKNGFNNLFAIMLDINTKSKKALESLGFEIWGHLPDIAEFENYTCGQYYMGKKISI